MIYPYKISITILKTLMINLRISILRLKGCVERHAPLKKLTSKEIKLKHKPWITVDINKMIKIKNKLFQHKKSKLII